MAGSFDELIEFLLARVALCGAQGMYQLLISPTPSAVVLLMGITVALPSVV
jgi:hypothetical protein